MSITKSEIDQAVAGFEKNNCFEIKSFIPYDCEETTPPTSYYDDIIAESVFFKRISRWLNTCGNDRTCSYLLELLQRFNYYTPQKYVSRFHKLVREICAKERINESDILYVTPASPNHCRSGGDHVRGAIIQAFCGRIASEQIRCYSDEELRVGENFPCVVFVDDIVGSGCTMYGLVYSFYKKNPWLLSKHIYIACLCGSEKVINKKAADLNKNLGLVVNPFILDAYKKCFGAKSNQTVIDYEHKINDSKNILENDKEKKCALGFDRSQLLVSFYYGTPNNTLSCFWRRTKITPAPLFFRCPKQPRVDDLKKCRAEKTINAYEFIIYGIGKKI